MRRLIKVVWTEQAWERLIEIEQFIARDDPHAAARLVDTLIDRGGFAGPTPGPRATASRDSRQAAFGSSSSATTASSTVPPPSRSRSSPCSRPIVYCDAKNCSTVTETQAPVASSRPTRQLQASLHHPALFSIGLQGIHRTILMLSQSLKRLVEGQQMPSDDRCIELSGAHRPKLPRSMRAACAASIFRRCGT